MVIDTSALVAILLNERSAERLIVAIDAAQVASARDAARTFGRGRHAAALTFGDCFSYALAVSTGEPLLFVGEDFSRTDVLQAGASASPLPPL